jgi:hypothetical protein
MLRVRRKSGKLQVLVAKRHLVAIVGRKRHHDDRWRKATYVE